MSFWNAAGTPERQTIVEYIKQLTSIPTYDNRYQVFENMESDSQIPDLPESDKPASRSQLIDRLEQNSPPNDTERLNSIHSFCHDHTQEGEPVNAVNSAALGHVYNVINFMHHVRAHFSESPDQTRARIRQLLRISNPAQRLVSQKQSFESAPLSPFQMWAFHDEYQAEPFETFTDSREHAVVRLGLGHYDNTAHELARWTHRLPSNIKPFKPTAWDADAKNVYWRPGGKTHPLHPGFGDGLPEVVHDPITAQEFVTAAEPLEA